MSLTASQMYGGQVNREQAFKQSIMFNTHVALPAVVQSYNNDTQTVEVQPTIRERTIGADRQISYIQYPLLINVPVAFPQVAGYQFTFPINPGDECLVIFADTAIDNWWLKGNVQNPVEQRRHDLSDGIAIFGLMNQTRLSRRSVKPSSSDGMAIVSTTTQAAVGISGGDGYIRDQSGREYSFSEMITKLNMVQPDGG